MNAFILLDKKSISTFNADIAFYLRGCLLDPAKISKVLGVAASKARQTGEKWRTRTKKEVVTKVGYWKLTAPVEYLSLSDKILWLRKSLDFSKVSPFDIPGVDAVEVSVFIALGSDGKRAVDYETKLTAEDLAWLSSIGAIVSFSITYVDPVEFG